MLKRTKQISFRLLLLFLAFALVLSVAISLFSYFTSKRAYSDFYSQSLQRSVALIATLIDGDELMPYLDPQAEIGEYYVNLQETLSVAKEKTGVDYLYLFSPRDDSLMYIIEAMLPSDDPSHIAQLGEIFQYTSNERTYLVPDVAAQRASTATIISQDPDSPFEASVQAWTPVFNSAGEFVAMLEADLSLSEVLISLAQFVTTTILLSVGIIIVAVVLLVSLTHKMVAKPLAKLTQDTLNFVSGDSLSYVSDIKTGDEMQVLSEALERMSDDIKSYTTHIASVAADEERLATQMSVVRNIEGSLLPAPILGREDCLVAGLKESVGIDGSFYDFFPTDDHHICVVAAETSGSGVTAMMYMIVAKTMIKNQMMTGMPVSDAVGILNTHLYESGMNGITLNAFVGVLDTATGQLSYVNAGYPTPILMQSTGARELPRLPSTALATTRNVVYSQTDIKLVSGDKLLLYSENVTAAASPTGEAYGTDRLNSFVTLSRTRSASPEILLRNLRAELEAHSAQNSVDITALTLYYTKGDKSSLELNFPPVLESFPSALDLIRRRLAENNIGGAFYAELAVILEELFVLIVKHREDTADITLRCGISDTSVEVRLLFRSGDWNLTKTENPQELSVSDFIQRRGGLLTHEKATEHSERDVLTLTRAIE